MVQSFAFLKMKKILLITHHDLGDPGVITNILQKDHILPARCLDLSDIWKNETFNVQWLCQYHNRLKTNSIGIGMAMIGLRRQD